MTDQEMLKAMADLIKLELKPVGERLDKIDERLDKVEQGQTSLRSEMHQEISDLSSEMNERFDDLHSEMEEAWKDIESNEKRIRQHEREFHQAV